MMENLLISTINPSNQRSCPMHFQVNSQQSISSTGGKNKIRTPFFNHGQIEKHPQNVKFVPSLSHTLYLLLWLRDLFSYYLTSWIFPFHLTSSTIHPISFMIVILIEFFYPLSSKHIPIINFLGPIYTGHIRHIIMADHCASNEDVWIFPFTNHTQCHSETVQVLLGMFFVAQQFGVFFI